MADDLKEKLQTYAEQLQQVEGLLATDPENEQFQKLRQDLLEVTKLTEDLLKYKHEQAEKSAYEEGDVDNEVLVAPFQVGMRCEAYFALEEKWFPAVVTQLNEDGTYGVVYIGFGNSEVVGKDGIRPLLSEETLLDPSTVTVGFECVLEALFCQMCSNRCAGRFSGDSKYYNCVVEELTDFGYKVSFTEYGNSEELPLEYLRLREEEARNSNEVIRDADGSYRIPEHLRLQPTDNEAERQRKRRKVKALKQKVKTREDNEARDTQRSSWQTFQNKGAKRKVAGSMKTARKESIFASPTSVDGKVGVTGSGKALTEFVDRKKFKITLPAGR